MGRKSIGEDEAKQFCVLWSQVHIKLRLVNSVTKVKRRTAVKHAHSFKAYFANKMSVPVTTTVRTSDLIIALDVQLLQLQVFCMPTRKQLIIIRDLKFYLLRCDAV